MNVLILTQYFWPETFVINDIARLLVERDIDVTVLTGKPNYPSGTIFNGYRTSGIQREKIDGANVIRLPHFARGQSSKFRLALNYISFILSASFIGPFVLRGKPVDVIFVYATSPLIKALAALVIGRLKGAPVVVWVQDLWPESLSATGHVRNPAILGLVGALVRHIYRRSSLILLQSRAFEAAVLRYCRQPHKLRYFPNLHQVVRSPAPEPATAILLEQLRQSFSVVFAGNIGTAQDPEIILETAILLRDEVDIRIVLVGSGSRADWIQQRAKEHGLTNLFMAGRFEPEEMPHIYSEASALLVTLKAEEIFALTVPAKVQSYLAAARPIVGALDGEAARIIAESRAGIAVPSGNAPELAAAIQSVYRMSEDERSDLGERGRAYYDQNFDPQKLANDLVEHLRDAAAAAR